MNEHETIEGITPKDTAQGSFETGTDCTDKNVTEAAFTRAPDTGSGEVEVIRDEDITLGTADDEEVIERPKGRNKIVKRIGLILFILLNAGVIYYTASVEFTREKPPPPEPFTFVNILFLLGGILCLLIVLGCETLKYILMMRHLGERVSVRHAFTTAALGKYYDCITPSGAGGQPFQIWHLHSNGYSGGAASAMPLASFFTMQFGFASLAILVVIFKNNAISETGIKITAYIGTIAYLIIPVMIIITGVAPKIAMRIVAGVVRIGAALRLVKEPNRTIMRAVKVLHNYSTNLKKITSNRKLLIQLLLLSVLFQVAMCSMPFFVVHTFGGNLSYVDALAMCVFIQAAITLIPTPGNSGAAEGSFYLVFSQLNTTGTFWAMLIWRFLCYYSFILIGVMIYGYNALIKLRQRKKEKLIEEES